MKTSTFKVMQIYSDRRGSQVVAEASGRLKKRTQAMHCRETVWNTELLRSAKLRMMAAREAADADVVVLALQEGSELSPEICQWLNLWRRRQRTRRSALFAILRREDLRQEHPVEEALQKFAESAQMDFFCHSRLDVAAVRTGELVLQFLQ